MYTSAVKTHTWSCIVITQRSNPAYAALSLCGQCLCLCSVAGSPDIKHHPLTDDRESVTADRHRRKTVSSGQRDVCSHIPRREREKEAFGPHCCDSICEEEASSPGSQREEESDQACGESRQVATKTGWLSRGGGGNDRHLINIYTLNGFISFPLPVGVCWFLILLLDPFYRIFTASVNLFEK